MKTVTVKIDPVTHAGLLRGRVNKGRLDATSEKDIVSQIAKDNEEAMQDAAKFARRVRRRLGLSQLEFSHRIDIYVMRSYIAASNTGKLSC
jgi:putative transcriptional regulator